MSYNALTDKQKVELWNKYRTLDLEMLLTRLANKEKRVKELEAQLKESKKQQASKEVKATNKKLREERDKYKNLLDSLTGNFSKINEAYDNLKKNKQNNDNNPQA